MLFQNGRHIRLSHVVFKGTVAEDNRDVSLGFKLFVPLGNAEGQRIDFPSVNMLVEAGEQRPGTDGVHSLACNDLGLDGHAQVETELKQQLVEDVVLASIRFDVVDTVEQRSFQVVAVRLPNADIGRVELEDAEAEVASERRVV